MKSLQEKYLENAQNYAEAYKAIFEDEIEGDEYKKYSRLEKKSSKKCHEIFEELRRLNRLNEIDDIMFNNNPYVRYLAASHCLFSDTQTAELVLEELIESKNHKIQMHALTSLKAWRNISWEEDRYK